MIDWDFQLLVVDCRFLDGLQSRYYIIAYETHTGLITVVTKEDPRLHLANQSIYGFQYQDFASANTSSMHLYYHLQQVIADII